MKSTATSAQKEIDAACFEFSAIRAVAAHCIEKLERLRDEYRADRDRWDVVFVHADRLKEHAAAIQERLHALGSPAIASLFSPEDVDIGRIPNPNELVEHSTAYHTEKIRSLNVRDIEDAIEFNTELRDTFGIAVSDEEVDTALTAAMLKLLEELEGGSASVPGLVILVLKALMKAHPRAFGRYYTGVESWPRPSAVVQAEIDTRMPDALSWLRFELHEALDVEASGEKGGGQ